MSDESQDIVTYASLSAVDEGLLKQLHDGVESAKSLLGRLHPLKIADREAQSDSSMQERAPADQDLVIGEFGLANPEQGGEAVAEANRVFSSWAGTPLEERTAVLRRAAARIDADRFLLAGVIIQEVGKTSLEALAEVDEAAVLLRLYCDQIEAADGFRTVLGQNEPAETSISVLRPYGVWLVISPFNFPLALAVGPTAAALVTGNTVIIKPSPRGQLIAGMLREILVEAGVPPEAVAVTAGGGELGSYLAQHDDVAGVTFTGSYAVGSQIARALAGTGKPVISEMGGKNPAVVAASGDLSCAVEGVASSAFGYSGQKCSSCSRAYVHEDLYEDFLQALGEHAAELRVGDPVDVTVSVGPVISRSAVDRLVQAVEEVRGSGGSVVQGGERLSDGDRSRGFFVQPTVVVAPPGNATVWRDELFTPLVAVARFSEFSEAIALANDTEYGLTAGLYSSDQAEIERFFDRVGASVVYANRRSGATTGAWPGTQPISGWGHSGNTGKGTGGPYYLPQYLREQSRNVERVGEG